MRKRIGPGDYKLEFEWHPASAFDYEPSFEAGEDEEEVSAGEEEVGAGEEEIGEEASEITLMPEVKN